MINEENRVCKRCRSIFWGDQTECVCPTCLDTAKRADTKHQKINSQQQPPDQPLLRCLIQRPGITTVSVGGAVYTFTPNAEGHSVCKVTNPAHNKFLIKSGHYAAYEAGK